MKHAISTLEAQRETSLHNAEIQESEGRAKDAALSRSIAADCSRAIDQISPSWNGAPNSTAAGRGE